jgi:hypothetical protein
MALQNNQSGSYRQTNMDGIVLDAKVDDAEARPEATRDRPFRAQQDARNFR